MPMIHPQGSEWPDEWLAGLDALSALPAEGAIVLLTGPPDSGKTTFTTLAARTLAGEGAGPVAVIDADIGQGEIGPPGTVGVAWATSEMRRLHELRPAARFFVGAISPAQAVLELVVAVTRAANWARTNGATRILVDTTGFVAGPAAWRLKIAKAQALVPNLILGFGPADGEGRIGSLLPAMQAASGAKSILRLETPESLGRKPAALRATRRLTRLSQALEGAREVRLPLSQIVTLGTHLGAGGAERLAPELARWTGTALRLPVVHGEQSGGTLTLFLAAGIEPRRDWERDSGPVAQHFGCRTIRAISLSALRNVLIGLGDEEGRFLAPGRWLDLDPERGEAVLSAPLPASTERIRVVHFGRVRVGDDGAVISEIRPGEI